MFMNYCNALMKEVLVVFLFLDYIVRYCLLQAGPMEDNIAPDEASDRLNVFQVTQLALCRQLKNLKKL